MRFDVCTARTVCEKNKAALESTTEFILFCGSNHLRAGALEALSAAVAAEPETTALFELRRFPCEHTKYYNPATCEAVWACGDSVLVRRSAFLAVGGFEETVFEDIADVDLSWRLRAAGWNLRYVPAAGIDCDTPQSAALHDAQLALAQRITGNLLLRLRFGTQKDFAQWELLLQEMAGNVSTTPAMEHCFQQRMKAVKQQTKKARAFYAQTIKNSAFIPQFIGFEPAFLRAGEQFHTVLPQKTHQFTIVMRAYKRPAHLARTLHSLRWQTYQHFCVIVVEDGESPVCEAVCKAAAEHMSVQYHAMRANAGRCETGNTGVRLAKTQYVCFLDDDDYFFAEHLETMAAAIEARADTQCRLFFAGSLEAACEAGEALQVQRYWNNCMPQLTLADFFRGNPASIQAVVFHTSLLEQCKGLDPKLDALEDWDLWLRFALASPFVYVDKTTSLYRVPAQLDAYAKRAQSFQRYRKEMQPRLEKYCARAGLSQCSLLHSPQGSRDGTEQLTHMRAYAPTLVMNAENDKASSQHLAALRASAQAVAAAKGWRWAAPLRAATCDTKPAWFGPAAIEIATADEQMLNRFVFAARTSVFWKLITRGR